MFNRVFSLQTYVSGVEATSQYDGLGTKESPYIVEFQRKDPNNPFHWTQRRKWLITSIVTMSVFVVTLTSSAPASSSQELIPDFNISRTAFTLSISLFVLGFAIGPAFWGPMVRVCLSWIQVFFIFLLRMHETSGTIEPS